MLAAIGLATSACGGSDPATAGTGAAITDLAEASDEECPNGGHLLRSGTDDNGDGELQEGEIDEEVPVCDSGSSEATLVETDTISPGDDCEAGGVRITIGSDANGDGEIQAAEIDKETTICDGTATRIATSEEPPGDNCQNGGLAIKTGVDADGDGTLQSGEVDQTRYVCNGEASPPELVETTREDSLSDCPAGGVEVKSGVDSNGDGTLSSEEVQQTVHVCDGEQGGDSLIATSTDASACDGAGGTVVEVGTDDNGDGTLDSEEVATTETVCNGAEGSNSLIETSELASGSSTCPNGGTEIKVGVDDDGDGSLQSGEVDATRTACNGKQSLIETNELSAGSDACPSGGTEIQVGVDDDGNGSLESGEVQTTRTACNGTSAMVDLRFEYESASCDGNSLKTYRFGEDADGDGSLSDSEVTGTFRDCGVTTKQVSAGYSFTCAVTPDGSGTCWGDDTNGKVSGVASSIVYDKIGTAKGFACGLTLDGEVDCWGNDVNDQVSGAPTGTTVRDISLSEEDYACALFEDDTPTCWGGIDKYDQVSTTPTSTTFQEIDAGVHHNCGIETDGSINCWGRDDEGQVSDAPAGSSFVGISAGQDHTCAWESDGTTTCWGFDSDNVISDKPSVDFQHVSGGGAARALVGGPHACGVVTDSSVECWGNDRSNKVSDTPTDGSFVQVNAGYTHNCALRSDGVIECWGSESNPPASVQP